MKLYNLISFRTRTFKVIFMFVVPFLIFSCNDVSEPCSNSKSKLNFYLTTINTDIDYSFFSYQTYTEALIISGNDTIEPDAMTSYDRADAFLHECDEVTYNNNSLDLLGGGSYHTADGIFSFDGNYHVWNVDGDADMPDITDSIVAPSAFSYITSPSRGASLDRISNLTITWSPNSTCDAVSIMIVPGHGQTDGDSFQVETTDNGSYTILASKLSSLSAGTYSIVLRRGNYKIGSVNSENYFMGIWSQHIRDITFTN